MRLPLAPGLAGLLGAVALGCTHIPFLEPRTAPAPAPNVVVAPPAVDPPVPPPLTLPENSPAWFRIGDRVVRESELDAWIREDLFDRELSEVGAQERWGYRAEAAERMIDELILEREAERRGIDAKKVLEAEIAALGPVTAAELLQFFEQNRERWPAEMSFEGAVPDIEAYLEGQRPRHARENLRRRARVRFLSDPPNGRDSDPANSGGPLGRAPPP